MGNESNCRLCLLGLSRARRSHARLRSTARRHRSDSSCRSTPSHVVWALAGLSLSSLCIGTCKIDSLPAKPAASLYGWYPAAFAALNSRLRTGPGSLGLRSARLSGKTYASPADARPFPTLLLLLLLCLLLRLLLLLGARRRAVQVVVGVVPQVAQAAQPAGTSGRRGRGAGGGRVNGSRGRPGGTKHSPIAERARVRDSARDSAVRDRDTRRAGTAREGRSSGGEIRSGVGEREGVGRSRMHQHSKDGGS